MSQVNRSDYLGHFFIGHLNLKKQNNNLAL